MKITIQYGLTDAFNEYGKRVKRPKAHKIRHDGNQCCSFCSMEKSANQAVRRFIYGRPEQVRSTRNLTTQRAYSVCAMTPPKRYLN